MRVLIAVHHYPPHRVGGAELLAQRQARWLAQQGIETRVVCVETLAFGAPRVTWNDEELDQIPVRRLHLRYSDTTSARRAAFEDKALAAHFRDLISGWQPDLVHLISGYLLGAAPLNAAHALHIPTVVTLTDFWFLCPTIQLLRGDGSLCQGPEPLECARCLYDERGVFRAVDERAPTLMRAFWKTARAQTWLGAPLGLRTRLEQLNARHPRLITALNQTDAIIALTRFVAEMHIANGVAADKIIVKPDCLDVADFDSFAPRVMRADEIHFGYLGQITPVKGVDVLLRAFLKARVQTRKKMQLHIHGNLNAQPAYVRQLQQLAARSPEITFHGAYEHRRALALLNELEAVIVPSLWHENSPRVILEAFAARRPVIGARVGGIAEVVHENGNGLLFERGDAGDLARVLLRVVAEPALLPRLAEKIPPPRTLAQDMRDVLQVYERAHAQHPAEQIQ